ncbi:hypothetical protein [Streptomyces sp. NPDC088554]
MVIEDLVFSLPLKEGAVHGYGNASHIRHGVCQLRGAGVEF